MTKEAQRWEELVREYNGLAHVPRTKVAVAREHSRLLDCGMDRADALEQAMITCAYKKDTRPTVMVEGAAEYEMIIQGGQIWADIQKSSER